MASRAGGNTNAGVIEMNHNVFTLHIRKRNVRSVRQTPGAIRRSIKSRVGNRAQYFVFQFVSETLDPLVLVEGSGQFTGRSQGNNIGNGRSPCAPPSFLSAANDEWRQLDAVANVERANALRRVQLVTRQSE